MTHSPLYLGSSCALDGKQQGSALHLPAHHLTTHSVVVGMTGSGKTGLLTVMVEEALRQEVPVLMIDVKGDLPNLLLAFPGFGSELVEPWVEPAPGDARTVAEVAAALAGERERGLTAWGFNEGHLQAFAETTEVTVITPGSSAGVPLHVLSSLEKPVSNWQQDAEGARASLSAAVSLLLRLLGRDADPASSRDHVLLSVLGERRLRAGLPSDLASLLEDVVKPPLERIGALPVDKFLPKRERASLAAALNTLLASPTLPRGAKGCRSISRAG